MNGLPLWVQAGLSVEGLDLDNYRVSERGNRDARRSAWRQGSDNGKLSASRDVVRNWGKLGPLTQEKGLPRWGSLTNLSWSQRDLTPMAGHTCDECPSPQRAYSEWVKEHSKDSSHWVCRTQYTERCTECNRKMRRWSRARRDADEAQIASECYSQGISFVTLTLPNMMVRGFSTTPAGGGGCNGKSPDTIGRAPISSIRELKRRVASFRKRFPEDLISGGIDNYEWTVHPDDAAWSQPLVHNVHMHGIWVMDYWKQAEFQDRWGEGIVHVKRLKSAEGAVRYATKYASKSDVKGIRLKDKFGCLYGRARRAMLDAYAVRQAAES